MSLCSQSLRAISRSRGPRSNTFLPFLYQTATIQQWKPATRPNARRNVYSRSKPTDDIPFADADGNLPPSVDEAQSTRKTTITDTERAAFEKLYKTFKAREHGEKDKGEHEELDQIADEYYEDDEEQKHTPLDKVFEELLYGKPQSKPGELDRLRTAANSIASRKDATAAPRTSTEQMEETPSPHKKKQLAAKAEKERIRKIRLEERDRIDSLLKNAHTDRDLWSILDREVFDQLRKLNLDEPSPAQKAKRSKPAPHPNDPKARMKRPPPPPKSLSSSAEAQTLFANYPHHLITTLRVFRDHFPRSPLPHSLLPTIKALGRSSYALGATTLLYQNLIRGAWVQQSSYALIDKLLTDMDTNIVDFDAGILRLLDAVIREYDQASKGRMGKELQMVYGMESWREGMEKIRGWREDIAGRLGEPQLLETKVGRPVRLGTSNWRRKDDRRKSRVMGQTREQRGGRVRHSDEVPFVEGQAAEVEVQSNAVADPEEGNTSPHDVVREESQLERSDEIRGDDADRPVKVML